jgi:hypothetical protein
MTNLLILVKDNINNTYSIYDNNNHFDSGFKNCIEFLQEKSSLQFKHIIIDDICELFCEKQTINKGWVWNTDITDTIKMYTLSFISYVNKNISNDSFTQTEIETTNIGIQASPIPIITKNTIVQTDDNKTIDENIDENKLSYSPINYFKYEIDEGEILDNSLHCYSDNENLQFKYCNNSELRGNKNQDYNFNETNFGKVPSNFGKVPSNFGKVPCFEANFDKVPSNFGKVPCSLSSSSLNIHNKDYKEIEKYKPDYSLNDRLIFELKKNLKTSNYGLRRRKKRIFENEN